MLTHLTEEPVLLKCFTDGTVGTGVGGAWIDSGLAIVPSVARPAEAGEVTRSRFVAAHGAIGARVGVAVRVLDQALEAGVSVGAVASKSGNTFI